MGTIRIKIDTDKVLINKHNLRIVSGILYTEDKDSWVQIDKQDIKSFIAEQKAQIENSVVTNETTEVKTE